MGACTVSSIFKRDNFQSQLIQKIFYVVMREVEKWANSHMGHKLMQIKFAFRIQLSAILYFSLPFDNKVLLWFVQFYGLMVRQHPLYDGQLSSHGNLLTYDQAFTLCLAPAIGPRSLLYLHCDLLVRSCQSLCKASFLT